MTKPKRRTPIDLKSLARGYTVTAVKTLGGISETGESENARVAASIALLDRGWGKPNQPHDATVNANVQVTIRNLIEEAAKKK